LSSDVVVVVIFSSVKMGEENGKMFVMKMSSTQFKEA
jgi:hypothetical protein